jgi:acetylglutamate kinase
VSRCVLKVGGAVAGQTSTLVRSLVLARHEVVVVHGAGPQISARMRAAGLSVEFVSGRRVTSAAALAVVRDSLSEVNRSVCEAIGPLAVGMLGEEIGIRAVPVPELGLVGDPLRGRPPAIEAALAEGRVPVVAPLAEGPLNVNADELAAALAVGLEAERIIFATDVPGLLHDGSVVDSIAADDADRLLADGGLEGGILPKLQAAITAARSGVRAEIGETAVVA